MLFFRVLQTYLLLPEKLRDNIINKVYNIYIGGEAWGKEAIGETKT